MDKLFLGESRGLYRLLDTTQDWEYIIDHTDSYKGLRKTFSLSVSGFDIAACYYNVLSSLQTVYVSFCADINAKFSSNGVWELKHLYESKSAPLSNGLIQVKYFINDNSYSMTEFINNNMYQKEYGITEVEFISYLDAWISKTTQVEFEIAYNQLKDKVVVYLNSTRVKEEADLQSNHYLSLLQPHTLRKIKRKLAKQAKLTTQ